ncbi:MAG: gluconate 2-dehydrogenase subunit 3 family protein [Janthinobacterium lividum]
MMNRRDALARVALLMGGTLIGADYLLTGCGPSTSSKDTAKDGTKAPGSDFKPLDAKQIAYLDEVGDTILPPTKSPGAKAAQVGSFMAVMVRDCYDPADQKIFLEGFDKLEAASQKQNGKGFLESTPEQRTALLKAVDTEQTQYSKTKKVEEPNHYFRMIKELTLLGFFTSKVGATEALRYQPVPGKYDGCIPYKKGDKAWATS